MANQIYPLDGLKESVRLAAGLTSDRRLDSAAQQRGVEALSRFAERLRGFEQGAVRAVATNALRVAKNAEQFLEKYLGAGVVPPGFAGASGNVDPWFRILPGFNTTNGWIPEQKLTLDEALHAYTVGSAYAEFADSQSLGAGVGGPS